MKRIMSLFGLLALVLAIVSGCAASAAAKPSIEVGCDEFQKQPTATAVSRQVTLGVGDTLTVALCSNPSTGFKWEAASIADGAVLEQVEQAFVAPTASAVGATGKETWAFKALKPGKTTVGTAYSRPWEGGEKGVWSFSLKVEVK